MRAFIFILSSLLGCTSTPPVGTTQALLESTLEKAVYCTLVYDELKNMTTAYGQASFCSKRTAALGSFQVPLALMSFDAGVLPNEQVKLSWDGLKRAHPLWNKDHTAYSWMRYSVNWYGQRLAKLLGPEKMQSYVEKMNFGNKDLTGGLATAWLTGPKESKITNTLKISPKEWLQFWNQFWREDFELDKKSFALTKKILSRIPAPSFTDSKTWAQSTAGVLAYDQALKPQLVEGHFVGRIETKNGKYNFVTFLQGSIKKDSWEEFKDIATYVKPAKDDLKEINELDLASLLAEEITWSQLNPIVQN